MDMGANWANTLRLHLFHGLQSPVSKLNIGFRVQGLGFAGLGFRGYMIGVISGIYRDNGEQKGNYYSI